MTHDTLSRRELLRQAALASAALAGGRLMPQARAAERPARRPNVVFILSDDQNNDTLACFGGKVLTPHIDGLARGGVRFTRAYATASVCTPSRYTCLTGQYGTRCPAPGFLRSFPPGAQANLGFNVTIDPGMPHLGKVLHDAGYVTGFVGKWHTGGPRRPPYPEDGAFDDPKVAEALAENQRRIVEYLKACGFDYAASVYRGNLADHKLKALDLHNMEWVTKGALDFIEANKERPFFLHICPTLQHGPPPNRSIAGDWRVTPAGLLKEPLNVQAPRDSIAPRLKEAGIPGSMGHATWLDDGVGAVLKKLEELGLADNTLVIYFSDNATRGGKGTCYDGGSHTPALMHWKGHIAPGTTCDRLVENTDWAPTILDACGVTPPEGMRMDGRSLLPLLAGRDAGWRDTAFLEIGHSRAVVHGRWKYLAVRYPPALQKQIQDGTLGRKPYHMDTSLDLQMMAERAHPAYGDPDQLYDLEADPEERRNLAADPRHADTLADMKARLKAKLAPLGRAFGEFGA